MSAVGVVLFAMGFALVGYGLVKFERGESSADRAAAIIWIACVFLSLGVTVAAWVGASR